MGLVFLELPRRGRRHRMRQNEAAPRRQPPGRHLHNLTAVHLADHAADQHLLRRVAVAHKRAVLLQQICELARAEADPALVRHVLVTELFHRIQKQAVCVGRRRGRRVGVAALGRRIGEHTEHIRVKFRHPYLADLPRQRLARVRYHFRLYLVALVNDE